MPIPLVDDNFQTEGYLFPESINTVENGHVMAFPDDETGLPAIPMFVYVDDGFDLDEMTF